MEENKNVEEFKEPKVGFAKFENPGDFVVGTYIGKQKIEAKDIYPEQIGYNLLVDGSEMVVAINKEKAEKYIDKVMRGVKIGQRVKFLFEDWFETDAYKKALEKAGGDVNKVTISRAKTIKVLVGDMDEEYLNSEFKEQAEEVNIDDIPFN